MRSTPRPQDSINLARKNALAMFGLKGSDGCLPSSRAMVQAAGSCPGFQIIILSAYTLIWIILAGYLGFLLFRMSRLAREVRRLAERGRDNRT